MAEVDKAQWGNPIEFILSVIGTAVGLGNVWRFPYLVFKHNGGPFLIPFFVLLFIIGIPTFFLETAVGQFSGLAPSISFGKMVPLFEGLGYAAVLVNSFIGLYYNVIIAYFLHYLVMSFREKLEWQDCNEKDILCYQRKYLNDTSNCTLEKIEYAQAINVTVKDLKSPTETYFYDTFLERSDSIEIIGVPKWDIVIALAACWLIVLLVLIKGVQILGKVSYFTATFPYVIMTILVVSGATLKEANEGVKFYLTGKDATFDFAAMFKPELLKDAAGQMFFALSSCTGALIAMSSFSPFNNNLIRDTFLVPILDIATGFYAGFAVFTVLGNMAYTKCAEIADVAKEGPELTFIVYPEGISLMESTSKALPPIFSVLFFIMMLALGFGSEFGIMETTMTTVISFFKKFINSRGQEIFIRVLITFVYFSCGLLMTTKVKINS